MSLNLYDVEGPNTEENTSWCVYADSPVQAAEFYCQAILDEEISVDVEDLHSGGHLLVRKLGLPEPRPGIVKWHSADDEKTTIPLVEIEVWQEVMNGMDTVQP